MAWFLQSFQQGVCRCLRHRFGGFNHHHASLGLHGLPCQTAANVSNLLQPQLWRGAAAEPRFLGFGAGQQTALMLIGGFDLSLIHI